MTPTTNDSGETKQMGGGGQTPPSGLPASIGRYKIERKIGGGGMGSVYLAVDSKSNRKVALKVLSKSQVVDPKKVQRFQDEAEAIAKLRHRNIVEMYEAGEAEGYSYIALEYIDGIDAHEFVRRGGVLTVKSSVEVVKQVVRALDHASRKGLVHRDIKPSNLLIRRDGMVKLTDLGVVLWKDDERDLGLTDDGITVGTADYISPEQAGQSRAVDVRSDIYSLGCTWYQLLTGEPPFPGGNLNDKLKAHASNPPPDPRAKNDSVTEAVVAILHKMLSKSPDDRYQTPAELLDDLELTMLTEEGVSNRLLGILAEEGSTGLIEVLAMPDALPPPSAPQSKRRIVSPDAEAQPSFELRPTRMSLLLLAALLLLLVWWASDYFNSGASRSRPAPEANPFLNGSQREEPGDAPTDTVGSRTEPESNPEGTSPGNPR